MLDRIKSFFSSNLEPPADHAASGDDAQLRLAACALLLELAYADNEFSENERTHIEQAMIRHFDLDTKSVAELIELAQQERRRAIDHFGFTSLIASRYDLAQKMVLAEVMWGVVAADGQIASHEGYMMRKLSHLLGIEPGFLAEARRRADPSTPR